MPRRSEKNKYIEVILLQDDKHLWEKYHVVPVKPIFAKNVLFPKNIAVLADKSNRNKYEQKMQAAIVAREKKATNLEELFLKIENDGPILLTKKTNKDGTLYAKVGEHDLVEKIKELYDIEVEPHLFKMKKKIQEIGQFSVPFSYNDLKRDLLIKIESEWGVEVKEESVVEENVEVEKTKEELKAEREAQKAKEKAEKIAKLKEKYK